MMSTMSEFETTQLMLRKQVRDSVDEIERANRMIMEFKSYDH